MNLPNNKMGELLHCIFHGMNATTIALNHFPVSSSSLNTSIKYKQHIWLGFNFNSGIMTTEIVANADV